MRPVPVVFLRFAFIPQLSVEQDSELEFDVGTAIVRRRLMMGYNGLSRLGAMKSAYIDGF